MFSLLKKHYAVILLALFIGLVTLIPQFVAISSLGEDWRGVYPIVNDDEVYYQVRGQEIVDGHYFLTNPYLAEYKSGSPMQFWLPDFLVAFPLKLLNIPIAVGYKIYDFLFPIILAILSYTIIYVLTGNKKISLLGTAALHLGLFLSLFNRTPSPQFIFIFWQLLALFIILFEKLKNYKYLLLAVISFALLFYMYPYYWTYYVIFLGLYFILRLFIEKKFNWIDYLKLFFGTGFLAIPYFIMQFRSIQSLYYNESLVRLGMLDTHFPSGISILFFGLIALVFFIWTCYKKKISISNISLIVFTGIIACIVATNQHIITGKNLEFSSHYYNLSITWYIITLAYLFSAWLPGIYLKYKWLIRTLSLGIIGLIIFSAIGTINYQSQVADFEYSWQRYGPILAWLREDTEKDSVVYANDQLSSLIPAYTSNNVFYAREANLFFISDQEVEERFIINHYWDNFTDDFLRKNERAIWGTQFINSYNHNQSKNKLRKLIGKPEVDYVRWPQSELDRLRDKAIFVQIEDFGDLLQGYRVDYFIWDKYKDLEWNVSDFEKYELFFSDENFNIYKLD